MTMTLNDRVGGFSNSEYTILGMGIKKINDVKTNQFVALLSIFGLTLFLWIFEARARYLYCFLPMYIICASIGLDNIAQKIKFKKL